MVEKWNQIKNRVAEYAAEAWRNPNWAAMDFLSRFSIVRRLIRLTRLKRNSQFDQAGSVLNGISLESAHRALKSDGYVSGFQLPADALNDLVRFANENYCYGNKENGQGFLIQDLIRAQAETKSLFSIAVYHHVEAQLPLIPRLAQDPLILQIAANYFCAEPHYIDCRLWWTFPAGDEFDQTRTSAFFHSDRDDFSALRLFFYLTDVDEKSGPHELIRGSHNNKRIRDLFSLTERDCDRITNGYGSESLVCVTGQAGSGFLEDPFIFHRSTRPRDKPRLVLQLRYATRDHHQFQPINDELLSRIDYKSKM